MKIFLLLLALILLAGYIFKARQGKNDGVSVQAMEFPDDGNGDVLRRMQRSGMDFSRSYDVDFEHLFPTESGAKAMASSVSRMGYKAKLSHHEKGWDCQVVVHLKPTYEEITATEESLGKMAVEHGGKSDGWGVWQE
jgi:hypothetical protein